MDSTQHQFDNTRDMRYGEILVFKQAHIDVYNTTGMNDCPAELWDALDPEKLKKELHAHKVIKNGPHYWMMDSMTAEFGDKASFEGLDARWAAKPVYELVDPDGRAYVLQAHDEAHPIGSLAELGQQMKQLPKGWQYRTRTLTADLVLDLKPDQTIYAVGDEFLQYY